MRKLLDYDTRHDPTRKMAVVEADTVRMPAVTPTSLYMAAQELHQETGCFMLSAYDYEHVAACPSDLAVMQHQLDEIDRRITEARKRLQEAAS